MKRVNLGTDSSGRPLVIDSRTAAKLACAERRLGRTLTIVQGSYRGGQGAAASAGTHDGGGVIDIRTWDQPDPQQMVRVLRECGFIAWYRTRAQGFDPHIHAIDYGNPALSPSAAHQVREWEAGRNGLASRGLDDGPRVTIPKRAPRATPNITTFLSATDRPARRQAARRVAKFGKPAAKAAARSWLAADRARFQAARRAKQARAALKKNEVR